MFRANIVPGQGFLFFKIYRKSGGLASSGRPVSGGYKETNQQFYGMLMNASQKEIDQWKQNGHPITHKIICYGAMHEAKPTDYVMNEEKGQFYIQGEKNPANLDVTQVYYVEERFDLKEDLNE